MEAKELLAKIESIADMEGGYHTFKGKAVEDCILIPKEAYNKLKEQCK